MPICAISCARQQDGDSRGSPIEDGLASGVVDAEPEEVLKEIMARLLHG
jgi:hypothetical protein